MATASKARRRLTEALASKYWREGDARVVLEAWRASGEPLSIFARQHGISLRRLRWWERRVSADGAASAGEVLFFPVQLTGGEAEAAGVLEMWTLELAGGVSLKVPCSGGEDLLATTLAAVKRGWTC